MQKIMCYTLQVSLKPCFSTGGTQHFEFKYLKTIDEYLLQQLDGAQKTFVISSPRTTVSSLLSPLALDPHFVWILNLIRTRT